MFEAGSAATWTGPRTSRRRKKSTTCSVVSLTARSCGPNCSPEEISSASTKVPFVPRRRSGRTPSTAKPYDFGGRGGSESGASRARTGDLLDAIQTLSQLSYGPVTLKCNLELEVPGPVDAGPLVVSRRRKTQLNRATVRKARDRQEITAIELQAIRREGIDLFRRVRRLTMPWRVRRAERQRT